MTTHIQVSADFKFWQQSVSMCFCEIQKSLQRMEAPVGCLHASGLLLKCAHMIISPENLPPPWSDDAKERMCEGWGLSILFLQSMGLLLPILSLKKSFSFLLLQLKRYLPLSSCPPRQISSVTDEFRFMQKNRIAVDSQQLQFSLSTKIIPAPDRSLFYPPEKRKQNMLEGWGGRV